MTARPDRVSFYPTSGKLPAWLWEEMHAASKRSPAGTPSAVVVEGQRKIIVMDAGDWNAFVEAMDQAYRAGKENAE